MRESVERAVLRHALDLCAGHATALREAIDDLAPAMPFTPERLVSLDKAMRRILDQFAYRSAGRILEIFGDLSARMRARFGDLEEGKHRVPGSGR